MKQANTRMRYDVGCDVPLFGVTPAEVVLLAIEHSPRAKGFPFDGFTDEREVERSVTEEKKRLIWKYGKKRVTAAFPGAKPSFPVDFEEARAVAIDSVESGESGGPTGADITGAEAAYAQALGQQQEALTKKGE